MTAARRRPRRRLTSRLLLVILEDVRRDVSPDGECERHLMQTAWAVKRHRKKPMLTRPGLMSGLRLALSAAPTPAVRDRLAGVIAEMESPTVKG